MMVCISRLPASRDSAPDPRIGVGPAHNPGENTLARQPGTFRNGNRHLDGGTAPSTTLSAGTSFGFRRYLCYIASLFNIAAQIASFKSSRPATTSVDDSHGVVPSAAGTALSAWFPPARKYLLLFSDDDNARFQRRSPRSWSRLGDGNRVSSAFL